MANDLELSELVAEAGAAMTEPDFRLIVDQVRPILAYWGQTLELTRELTPVLVETDPDGNVTLSDRGVYVEDAVGGFWTLASGNPITDANGVAIERPTLEDLLDQAASADQVWQLEQTWSPASRGQEVEFRENAPYLMRIVEDRAVIDDFGIQNEDGSWRLASGREITDANGAVIATPTVEDIMALSSDQGQEWRVEEIGFNPYADIPVEAIGIRSTDGLVVDYTVEVTDQDGAFYVWARNLDRALELQFKTGDSREFNLRNYEVDFDNLDEVDATDESFYRVELLTPGEFHYATSLAGIDFREEMLSATLDNATGLIDYKVVEGGSYSHSDEEYESVIKPMILLVEHSYNTFLHMSRRLAVRVALQDGLSEYADGIEYDITTDKYRPTTDGELTPLFTAVFERAPETNDDDAIYDYLVEWGAILAQIYPDYEPADPGFLFEEQVNIDQAAIFTTIVAAFEATGIDLDIFAISNALSIDERRIITHEPTDTELTNQDGVNFWYISEGDQNVTGSYDADAQEFNPEKEETDIYVIGGNAGDDIIYDRDLGDNDQIRFASFLLQQ